MKLSTELCPHGDSDLPLDSLVLAQRLSRLFISTGSPRYAPYSLFLGRDADLPGSGPSSKRGRRRAPITWPRVRDAFFRVALPLATHASLPSSPPPPPPPPHSRSLSLSLSRSLSRYLSLALSLSLSFEVDESAD
jgi:hypothetical protein